MMRYPPSHPKYLPPRKHWLERKGIMQVPAWEESMAGEEIRNGSPVYWIAVGVSVAAGGALSVWLFG